MLWQGLQRDVQYGVTAVEMVICSGYWEESPAEREQAGDVPPPWEGGTGTLARLGITSLHEYAPFQTCYPTVLWLFQLHERDNAGQKEGLISMSCKGEAQKEQHLTASQAGGQCQAGQEHLHSRGRMETHGSVTEPLWVSGSASALAGEQRALLKGGWCKTDPDSIPCWKGKCEL